MMRPAVQGQSNEGIAKETDCSPQPVKGHLGKLMRDWNERNRTGLVTAARLRGVVRPRPGLRREHLARPDER